MKRAAKAAGGTHRRDSDPGNWVGVATGSTPDRDQPTAPVARAAATCSDYPNQKAAQEAADTRDGDGDGIYCDDLPCPCSSEAGGWRR